MAEIKQVRMIIANEICIPVADLTAEMDLNDERIGVVRMVTDCSKIYGYLPVFKDANDALDFVEPSGATITAMTMSFWPDGYTAEEWAAKEEGDGE